jgi:hypothetical protein
MDGGHAVFAAAGDASSIPVTISLRSPRRSTMSAFPPLATKQRTLLEVRFGRVEDGRGSLGHSATLRFPSPLIEPDVPISGIRLSDWLHREVCGEQTNRTRLQCGE